MTKKARVGFSLFNNQNGKSNIQLSDWLLLGLVCLIVAG